MQLSPIGNVFMALIGKNGPMVHKIHFVDHTFPDSWESYLSTPCQVRNIRNIRNSTTKCNGYCEVKTCHCSLSVTGEI